MGKSVANAMEYETPAFKISKSSARSINKREKQAKLENISVLDFAWAKIVQHKFGVLLTFTITYVWFSLLGTVTVGLVETLFN